MTFFLKLYENPPLNIEHELDKLDEVGYISLREDLTQEREGIRLKKYFLYFFSRLNKLDELVKEFVELKSEDSRMNGEKLYLQFIVSPENKYGDKDILDDISIVFENKAMGDVKIEQLWEERYSKVPSKIINLIGEFQVDDKLCNPEVNKGNQRVALDENLKSNLKNLILRKDLAEMFDKIEQSIDDEDKEDLSQNIVSAQEVLTAIGDGYWSLIDTLIDEEITLTNKLYAFCALDVIKNLEDAVKSGTFKDKNISSMKITRITENIHEGSILRITKIEDIQLLDENSNEVNNKINTDGIEEYTNEYKLVYDLLSENNLILEPGYYNEERMPNGEPVVIRLDENIREVLGSHLLNNELRVACDYRSMERKIPIKNSNTKTKNKI